jgi:hypothetical protein
VATGGKCGSTRSATSTPGLVHGDCDRQVLDRQAGRVEERDLLRPAPSFRPAEDDVADLRHPVAVDPTCGDGAGQLPASRGLRPVVAEEHAALERRMLELRLAPGVGSQGRDVLAGPQVGFVDNRRGAWRHRDHHVLGRRLGAIPRTPSELGSERIRHVRADVRADAGAIAGGHQAACRRRSVHATADDPHRLGVGGAE